MRGTIAWRTCLVFKCENKCESLCKQSQKTMKECSIELEMKATFSKIDTGKSMVPFLVPRGAVGTYGLAFVRPFVRSFVRSVEISKTAHRIVLIFGTKL